MERILGAELKPGSVSIPQATQVIRRKPQISPEGRARIAAAHKARWAKVKAAKKAK